MSKKNTNNTRFYLSILGIVAFVFLLIVFLPYYANTKLSGGEFLSKYNQTQNALIIDV